jgi:2,3-dihydroxy-p-cumate/2,3-dihydroxybenzoate 3,4-dioxygenase
MEISAREDDAVLLRCDERHHCLAFVEGPPGALAAGLTVADVDALERAETELEQYGIRVARGPSAEAAHRRVGDFLTFSDPVGNRVEICVDQAVLGRTVSFSREAGITEFGHLCLDAPVPAEAAAFWTSVFSARVSDRIGDAAYLLRIDEVHHKLALFANDEPGLCHINMQVDSLDRLMQNRRSLEASGVEIQSGPGRHPTSGAIFVYFSGPQNMTYEYSYGVALIDETTWRARNFPLEDRGSIDMSGGPPNASATRAVRR